MFSVCAQESYSPIIRNKICFKKEQISFKNAFAIFVQNWRIFDQDPTCLSEDVVDIARYSHAQPSCRRNPHQNITTKY